MKPALMKMLCTSFALIAVANSNLPCAFAQQGTPQASALSAGASPRVPIPDPGTAPQEKSRIRIGPGDLLDLSVFDFPELTQSVRVNDTGDASFNLIGLVHVAGLTTDEARSLIAGRLLDGNFVLNPQVSVFIHEYSTQGVSVVGEITRPGVYPVLGVQTLLDVIAAAGGTTQYAGPDATIERSTDNSTVTVRFSKDAQRSFATDVRVYPGDRVIVGRAGLVYVLGDVGRPGGFVMENDGKLTLLEALAMAGGSNPTASLRHARLIRKTATGYSDVPILLKKVLRGEAPAPQLQLEDVLYIPSNLLKSTLHNQVPAILSATSGAAIYHSM